MDKVVSLVNWMVTFQFGMVTSLTQLATAVNVIVSVIALVTHVVNAA